ncbi:MAG: sigma-70 family RNA polymerase sigma factor [Proteobacteria bacterium]|nr:sigma-70 family RNA polymerase sigma factor [Pseudomonadota bacterium]
MHVVLRTPAITIQPRLPRGVRTRARALAVLNAAEPEPDELAAWVAAIARHGDRGAFGALFRALAPRIKGFLMRMGADAGLAEDFAQETLAQVWRKAAAFDAGRAAVTTWVFTIARNLWIDQCRRAAQTAVPHPRSSWLADLAECEPAVDGEEPLLDEQRRERLRAVLAELPPEQAEAVRLAYFNDVTHERIAATLGIPLGTVKSRIRLGLAALRQRLDGIEL